jgi:hypothetical protein
MIPPICTFAKKGEHLDSFIFGPMFKGLISRIDSSRATSYQAAEHPRTYLVSNMPLPNSRRCPVRTTYGVRGICLAKGSELITTAGPYILEHASVGVVQNFWFEDRHFLLSPSTSFN